MVIFSPRRPVLGGDAEDSWRKEAEGRGGGSGGSERERAGIGPEFDGLVTSGGGGDWDWSWPLIDCGIILCSLFPRSCLFEFCARPRERRQEAKSSPFLVCWPFC